MGTMSAISRSAKAPRKARSKRSPTKQSGTPEAEYRVGPGRPPRAFQFKPGQSGNPKGAKKKPPSIVIDVKAMFEKALNATLRVRKGEKEIEASKLAIGLEQLANQFAKGDRYARRDVFELADRLGIDLLAGQGLGPEAADRLLVSANDKALLADYLSRHRSRNDQSGDDTNGNDRDRRAGENEMRSGADRGEKA
jgi:Family of unknown function (DUF5681)